MAPTITLAHFCDRHGPRSILCTQNATQFPEQFTLSDFSKESYCEACLLVIPKSRDPTRQTSTPLTTIKTNCENGQVFATTQYSALKFRQLNSVVRKCLSEETTVYDLRPMYFGDDTRGHSLTLSFKIKDLEARGSERRYSFIVNSEKEDEILTHWDTIIEHVKTICNLMIERRREFELQSATNNEIFLRGKQLQAKSLTELLGDNQIFVKIHLWNVKLLQKMSVT